MSLVKINWQPPEKVLREFSEFWLFFLGMVFAPLSWWRGHDTAAVAFWIAAVIGRLVGVWRPGWLKPVFLGLTLVTFPIGWVISHAALAAIYFGIFTPVALVFRLIGRDALERRLDRSATSYWEAYNPNRGAARYFRQF